MTVTDVRLAWDIEWAVALRRRRLLLLNVLIPLLLVAPLAAADPPPAHEAAVLAVLFVLFGVFGSAVPLVRDGASGLLLRLVQAGVSERGLLSGRILAQSALDAAQLAPAAALALAASAVPPSRWPAVAGALVVALVLANAVGAWAAAAARSLGEAALFSAVLALLMLHVSGVFRTPPPGGPGAALELWGPFRPLHEITLRVLAGRGPSGAFVPAFTSTGVLLVGTWFGAPVLTRLLVRAED